VQLSGGEDADEREVTMDNQDSSLHLTANGSAARLKRLVRASASFCQASRTVP